VSSIQAFIKISMWLLRAPDIFAYKATSTKVYCFYTDFSPLIDEIWDVLCNSGLDRTAQMRALKGSQGNV